VAYDLTGAVVRMQIRATQGSPVLVDASTVGVDPMITIGDPPTGGRIDIRFPATITDQMVAMPDPLGRYFGRSDALYDLEVVLPNGDVHRILQGPVIISANITQVP